MTAAPLGLPILLVLIAAIVLVVSFWRLRSLPSKNFGNARRRVQSVVLVAVVTLCAAAIFGTIFNVAAHDRFVKNHPAPGTIYDVGGYKMDLNCIGTGTPTVVLESGLGDSQLAWHKVQTGLSQMTRVCSYDRAGIGWSQPRPGVRDSDHINAELHALLQTAGVTGPIVLMGHSLAGITMRGYAASYPENIVGMVLVDGGTPLQETHGSPQLQAKWQKIPWGKLVAAVIMVDSGVPRMMGMCSHAKTQADFGVGALQYEAQCDPPLMPAIAEITQVHQDGLETIHAGPFDFPVLIFSQDWSDPNELKGFASKQITAEAIDQWNQMQEAEKDLSKDSRRIIARGTDHYVQVERADLLLKEVPPFIDRIRAHAPPGPENGTTNTE